MSVPEVPRGYRLLLVAYSPAWRRAHGEVALATLLELHAALGRSRPSLRDRSSFLIAGLRSRLPGGTRRRPLPALQPLPADVLRFDQENGATPPPSDELDEHGLRRDRPRNTGEGGSVSPAAVGLTAHAHGGTLGHGSGTGF